MRILLGAPTDLDELDRRIATERLAVRRGRYRVVCSALAGMKAMDVAAGLERSRDFVQTGAYAYRAASWCWGKNASSDGPKTALSCRPAVQRHGAAGGLGA